MARRHLHWSLLLAAIIFWLAVAYGIRREEAGSRPARVAALIESDLANRVSAAEGLAREKSLLVRWIDGKASEAEQEKFRKLPFYLFVYQGDTLAAWNTTRVLPQNITRSGRLLRLANGWYYGYAQPLQQRSRLCVLVPLSKRYPYNNEYLQASFAASPSISPQLFIADTPGKDAATLHAPDGRAIGYVHPAPSGAVAGPSPNWIAWCWIAGLVAFAAWISDRARKLSRKKGAHWATLLVIGIALGLRLAIMWVGPPVYIAETELFSPRLYASSAWLPSLGALLLHVLTVLWILIYMMPGLRFNVPAWNRATRYLLGLVAASAIMSAAVLFVRVVRSLVVDSLIPFDTAHLSALEGSTLSGLLVVSLLLSALLIVTRIAQRTLQILANGFPAQLLLLVGAALLCVIFYKNDALLALYCAVAGWLFVNTLGQYIVQLREGAGLFRVGNIFWSVAHCLLLALLLQHFSRIRESVARRAFAEHVATRHDDAMEFEFGQRLTLIRTDTVLHEYLKHPTPSGRKNLDERLAAVYFNKALDAYQPRVFLFDENDRPLYNPDSGTLSEFWRISTGALPSRIASDLYFRDTATNDHIYLALMPVEDSLGNYLGAAAIDLEQKRILSETVLPELLQPASINQAEKAAGYSYAIYADRRLVAQTSDYPFPYYLLPDTSRAVFRERYGSDNSTLVYRPDVHRTVNVWRRFGSLSEVLALFSYLLLLRFLLYGIAALYRQSALLIPGAGVAIKQLKGLGIRRRLQLSIMGIVALSLLAIGIVTVAFLKRQYDENSKSRRNELMHTISRAIQQWMKEAGADRSQTQWEEAMAGGSFRHFLSGLAADQKTDINLFEARGFLSTTSQQAVYDQGLLAPVMRYDVLRNILTQPRSLITEIEEIGTLRYQSSYTPLRLQDGRVAAILNVPLFYAQRELEEQISSVVITLINLYALALLMSAVLAYFITRWITRAFDVITGQMSRLSLRGNELLEWPYDDEIGALVAEYNKMVRKVESSVALLARNEREGAFREMARQVAHEIKNPLTPMSLYVQRLQQAIRSDQPDALALAARVSGALLEQINNLSAIATEFGAFAKLGTTRPEPLELTEIVQNVVAPFAVNNSVHVHSALPAFKVNVLADRSGLVRIITNLMQNAVQAIPADRPGKIDVRLGLDGREAMLQVTDNGSGITPEAAEKLFTPYFTTKGSGTGLGLAMSRQLVEAWGGSIDYETVPGEGTTFILKLPVADV